jgi:hypothetical protein
LAVHQLHHLDAAVHFGAGGAKLIWGEATAVLEEGRANSRQLWINEQTAPDLEKVGDAHLIHKAAHVGVILGVLGGRGWGGMIQGNGQSLRVLDPLNPQAVKYFGDSRRVIVTEGYIRGHVNHLARRHFRQTSIFG